MNEEAKSYRERRKDFCEKFRKIVVPSISQFEKERKENLKQARKTSIIFSFLGILVLLLLFIFNKNLTSKESEFVLSIAMFMLCTAYYSWYHIKKGFENKIKTKIMPIICSCFGDLKWSNFKFSNGLYFVKSGVISKYTNENYDDIFRGTYKDVTYEIVEASYSTGSGKNYRLVFNGAIVCIEMNKNFSGHTVITPDSFSHNSPLKGLQHTVLEDIEFEQKFDVYTDDEVNARYLITPSFMERLLSLKLAFKAEKVSCAFYDKYLIVALSTKLDLFSICSLLKRVDDMQQFYQMYEEIESIIKLIDHFKLDQKIGL